MAVNNAPAFFSLAPQRLLHAEDIQFIFPKYIKMHSNSIRLKNEIFKLIKKNYILL